MDQYIYGPPKTILSDQEQQYTAKAFRNQISAHGIKQIFASASSPTSNDLAERINQEISFAIKHFHHLGITAAVQIAKRRLRYCFHRAIDCSSKELLNETHPLCFSSKIIKPDLQLSIQHGIKSSLENQNINNKHRNKTFQYNENMVVYRRSKETGKLASL